MVPQRSCWDPLSALCVIYHWELYCEMKSLQCGTALLLLVLLDIFLRVSGACWVRDEVAEKFITLRSPTQHEKPFQLKRVKDSDAVDMILGNNLWTVCVSDMTFFLWTFSLCYTQENISQYIEIQTRTDKEHIEVRAMNTLRERTRKTQGTGGVNQLTNE